MSSSQVSARFFALRTALQPFACFAEWGSPLRAPQHPTDPSRLEAALAQDRDHLRSALRESLADPVIREAIWVASPSLDARLGHWLRDPESRKGRGVEAALVRYFARMAGRPTPFGLFAGGSVGVVGDTTHLTLPARSQYRRHTRLDMDYLASLVDVLHRDPGLREELTYRPNSSLYRAGGRLRYAEGRMNGRDRSYHLVAVDEDDYLARVLHRAEVGVSVAELVGELVDPEIDADEARTFVHEIIDSQILVPDLEPALTGPEAIHGLIETLEATSVGRAAATTLAAVEAALASLDADGLGLETDRYLAIADALGPLPAPTELPRLFQVDMVKPATGLSLPRRAVDEMLRTADALHRLFAVQEDRAFGDFRSEFERRYGDRRVPLVDALDEEIGIGFQAVRSATAEASPLLEGLQFPAAAPPSRAGWSPADAILLRKLTESLASDAQEIVLGKKDLRDLPPPSRPLPDSMHLMGTLVAASAAAVDRGDFDWVFQGSAGPSGARLLGRFCHADAELEAHVRDHLRAEEALEPDALFAEIVHLPQGRIGNILARPVLRGAEIAFLGRSGRSDPIHVDDLTVAIEGDSVVLRLATTGQRVLPRMSTAHNFSTRSLGLYKFLCMLQSQGVQGGAVFTWGALAGARTLPRVRMGRCIVSRAQWRLDRDELSTLQGVAGTDLYTAVQRLRAVRHLPRRVGLVENDNVLPVDLDNVLSVESFVDLVARRSGCQLEETWPDETALVTEGPEGRFVHEILIPVLRPRDAAPPPQVRIKATGVDHRFEPGSEWLYAKLYTGNSTAERVMTEALAPLVRDVNDHGLADRWFFIRFADPDFHLRLRFHGRPDTLLSQLLPRLRDRIEPFLRSGVLWNLQLEAYDRELSRYGGPEGIELCEAIFQADSEAALALTELTGGDDGMDLRWRLTLRGMDDLLGALGFDLAGKHRVLLACATGFGREFNVRGAFKQQIRDRYRRERQGLESLLSAPVEGPALEVLHRRRQQLEPLGAALAARAADGGLSAPLESLASSLLHMQANRTLRSAPRPQETLIYHFLERIYASRLARRKKRS